MKKIILSFLLVVVAAQASAQATVSCTLSGLTAGQQTLVDEFIADLNKTDEEGKYPEPGAPFANFEGYCAYKMRSTVLSFAQRKQTSKLKAVGTAAVAVGLNTATNAQCSAAGLASGCTKAQVACFVLTGNATCTLP